MTADEAKPFLKFISLTDLFYQQIFNLDYERALDNLLQFINNNSGSDDQMNISYCFNLIFQTFIFLPKHRDFFSPIIYYVYKENYISNCSSNISEFINKINSTGKERKDFINQIQEIYQECLDEEKKMAPIFKILQNDRLEELKEYINSCNDFDFNKKEIQYSKVLDYPIRYPTMYYKISYMDYCAVYGSKECFKFFLLNKCEINDLTFQFSIYGGDLNIIHSLDEIFPSKFNYHFFYSIIGHNLNISEWLLSNFKCEFFSPADCILFNDYRAFLFMVLNGADISCPYENIFTTYDKYYTLNLVCQIPFSSVDSIKLLVNKGAKSDLSKDQKTNFNYSALHYLCNRSLNFDQNALEYLLQNGDNPNTGTVSALYVYCSKNNPSLNIISLFLKYGASLNYGEKSPLEALCSKKQIDKELIEYLIKQGADINYGFPMPFYQLCKNPNQTMELIQFFVKEKAEIEGSIYMECKCNQPNFEIIKYLYDNGADVNFEYRSKNEYKFLIIDTPLSVLCKSNECNIEIVKFLLQNGAKTNYETISPLYNACAIPDANNEIIKLLLENGADPNFVNRFFIDDTDKPLLYQFCEQNPHNLEGLKILLSYGANPDCFNRWHDQDNGGTIDSNILCPLCKTDNVDLEMLKIVLEHKKDMNNGNQNPINCYLESIQQKTINFDTIKLLIDHGVDINKTTIWYDYSIYAYRRYAPFSYICCKRHDINLDIIKFFIENGANINQLYTQITDYGEDVCFSPLYSLLFKQTIDFDIIRYMFSHHADPNAGNYSILYALCSAENPDINIIKYVIQNGAGVNKLYENNLLWNRIYESPLYIICTKYMANCEIIQLLLDNGANPNQECCDKINDSYEIITPLYALTQNIQEGYKAYELLLDKGADINKGYHNITTNEIHSPLYGLCTAKTIQYETIEFLVKRGAFIDQETKNYITEKNIEKLLYLVK